MIIPVFLTFNDRFALPASVAIYSLLENANPEHNYYFHITASDISEKNRRKLLRTIRGFPNARITFIDMEIELSAFWNTLKIKQHYSMEACYKLFISNIFPHYSKVIITDVDVVFCGDVSEAFISFDTSGDCLFAGVKLISMLGSYIDENYRNTFSADELNLIKSGIFSGYLIANLALTRALRFEEIFLKTLRENADRLFMVEQDVINLTCAGRIWYLPLNTLVTNMLFEHFSVPSNMANETHFTPDEITYAMTHPIQRHYEGKPKPWEDENVCDFRLWYSYLKKTPYYADYQLIRLRRFRHLRRLIKKCVKVLLKPIKKCILYCMDKKSLNELRERHGLSIPARIARKIQTLTDTYANPSRGYVLMLHRVAELDCNKLPANENMKVSPAFLERFIGECAEAFDIIRSEDIPERLANGNKKKFVVFTIDDGYADTLTAAFPTFEKHNVPFTLFVPSYFPERNAILWWYALEDLLLAQDTVTLANGKTFQARSLQEKNAAFLAIREEILKLNQLHMEEELTKLFAKYRVDWYAHNEELCLTWDGLRTLAASPLVTIGGHTSTHVNLRKLPQAEDVCKEMQDNSRLLKRQLGTDVSVFAYPFGSPNEVAERETAAAEQSGFKCAFTAEGNSIRPSDSANLFALSRIMLTENFAIKKLR